MLAECLGASDTERRRTGEAGAPRAVAQDECPACARAACGSPPHRLTESAAVAPIRVRSRQPGRDTLRRPGFDGDRISWSNGRASRAASLNLTIYRNKGTPADRVNADYGPVWCRALFLTGQTPPRRQVRDVGCTNSPLRTEPATVRSGRRGRRLRDDARVRWSGSPRRGARRLQAQTPTAPKTGGEPTIALKRSIGRVHRRRASWARSQAPPREGPRRPLIGRSRISGGRSSGPSCARASSKAIESAASRRAQQRARG